MLRTGTTLVQRPPDGARAGRRTLVAGGFKDVSACGRPRWVSGRRRNGNAGRGLIRRREAAREGAGHLCPERPGETGPGSTGVSGFASRPAPLV